MFKLDNFLDLYQLKFCTQYYLARERIIPKLSAKQKEEILARIRAFNTSGFQVKMYGNISSPFVAGTLKRGLKWPCSFCHPLD